MSKLYILFITLILITGCGSEGRSTPRKLSDTDLYVDIKDSDTNQSNDENKSNPIINDEPCYIDSNSDNNSNNCNDNNITPQWPMDNNSNNGNDNTQLLIGHLMI